MRHFIKCSQLCLSLENRTRGEISHLSFIQMKSVSRWTTVLCPVYQTCNTDPTIPLLPQYNTNHEVHSIRTTTTGIPHWSHLWKGRPPTHTIPSHQHTLTIPNTPLPSASSPVLERWMGPGLPPWMGPGGLRATGVGAGVAVLVGALAVWVGGSLTPSMAMRTEDSSWRGMLPSSEEKGLGGFSRHINQLVLPGHGEKSIIPLCQSKLHHKTPIKIHPFKLKWVFSRKRLEKQNGLTYKPLCGKGSLV